MAMPEISWTDVWSWSSGSALLSAIITLAVGSYLLYMWQARRSFQYEVVKFISDEITSYANDAVMYWASFSDGSQNRYIARQKIRNGLPMLFELINSTEVLDNVGKARIHEALGGLFDAATGGSFESSEKSQKEDADSRIESILVASAVSRRILFLAAIKKN